MRSTNIISNKLLLSTLASISLYAAAANAQDNSDSAESSAAESTGDSQSNSSAEETSSAARSTTEEAASTTEEATSATEDASTTTEEASSTTEDAGSTISTTEAAVTGMPTLTRGDTVPTYPAASVPPTNNAPFMKHSSAPDGTVFIAVGAILGAFGIAILLWRVIVGFLLHRSVERAAKAQHDANAKAGFPAPPAPFYKYTDQGSTMSIGNAPGRGVRRTTRGPVLSSTPSASNLFFSPTAAASGNGGGNRGSTFLPSGFYAAGTSSPGANHDHSISLTNLRPDSRGQFANNLNPSPPDSPSFHARRDISNTSLNLNRPPSQRAPSAFLDDLLADDPSALPPPNMPTGGGRHSSYGTPGSQNRI